MSDSMVGMTLQNRYRLEFKIGCGGMSTVYCAYDTDLERKVAIKVMSSSALGTKGRNRLVREAHAIAKLNHPNIVTIHDVGEVDDVPFIVMEFVEGESLHEHHPQDLNELIAITRQICTALEHAHAHDIIHRDLKPENVVISVDGSVKLMDFGLARSMASRVTEEGTISGTVFYMAPELALGKEFDGRADLYALGVMLYELTTGRLPFTADDPLAVISQHLHAPVVPPEAKNPEIPPALNSLILDLLSKDPDDRPASARDVLAIFDQPDFLDQEAVPARELSVLERIERGRMVGREEELQKARALWSRTLSGEGQLLLISGEPGVGKTRFMREIATQAEVSGGQAYIGESQAEGNAPYAAFAQIIRRALRAHQNHGLELPNLVMAELISIAPNLQVDYPDIPPNPDLEPESEQLRLFECIIRFFSTICKEGPLLLVLEDIHWADSGTLSLLQFLARRCREHPVLLLGTYREVELDDALPFHQTLLDLNRKNLGTRLKLERLDEDKTREMLAVIFTEEVRPDFLAGIYQETEGNPFFIEEVCKALIESEQLYFDGEIWQRPPDMADLEIPQSIKVAVQSRVSKLSDSAQMILLTAAVIGREFDFNLLKRVTGKPEDVLIDSLESALKAQLIEELKEEDDERFSFSHALIPTTLRESLSGMRRTRMHRRVAQAMEEIMPDVFQRLAYHWGEGGDLEKGLDYTIKAAKRAQETHANQDAIRLFSEALDLLSEDDERYFDLLKNRSSMYGMLLNRDAQLADIKTMLVLAEKSGNQAQQVESLLEMGQCLMWTNPTLARKPVERALEISKFLGDLDLQARAEGLLAAYSEWTWEFSKIRPHLENAIAIAHDAGWEKRLADYLSYLLVHDIAYKVEMDTVKTRFQELLTLTDEINDKQLKALLFFRIANIYRRLNDFKSSLSSAEESLRLAEEIGDSNYRLRALSTKAETLVHMEKYKEAEVIYLMILEEPDIFSTNMPRFAGYQIGGLNIKMGEYEKFQKNSENLLHRAIQDGNEFLILRMQFVFTISCFHLGRYQESLTSLKNTWKTIKDELGRDTQAFTLSLIGLNHAYLGEIESANEYSKKAFDLWDETSTTQPSAEMWMNCARIALIEGKSSSLEQGVHYTKKGINILEGIMPEISWENFVLMLRIEMEFLNEENRIFGNIESIIEKALQAFHENYLIIEEVPESLYFVVSHGLRVGDRHEEADEYLHKAYDRVMLVAGNILDDDLRQSYLENVKVNREILREAKARGIVMEQKTYSSRQ